MTTETTVSVGVVRYSDGVLLGTMEMPAADWALYADCAHPAYQWPEGLAAAGDVLSAADLERLGVRAGEAVWLE